MDSKFVVSYEIAKIVHEKLNYPIYNNSEKTGFYNRKTGTYIYFGRTGRAGKEHLYGAPTKAVLIDWIEKKYNVKFYLCVLTRRKENSLETMQEYYVSVLSTVKAPFIVVDSKGIAETKDMVTEIADNFALEFLIKTVIDKYESS